MSPSSDGPSDAGEYHRAADVVWRLAPDRVLVRRVADARDLDDDESADLIGLAAAVWVGLDEPATPATLRSRLAEAGIAPTEAECADALQALVDHHWVVTAPDGTALDQPGRDQAR